MQGDSQVIDYLNRALTNVIDGTTKFLRASDGAGPSAPRKSPRPIVVTYSVCRTANRKYCCANGPPAAMGN